PAGGSLCEFMTPAQFEGEEAVSIPVSVSAHIIPYSRITFKPSSRRNSFRRIRLQTSYSSYSSKAANVIHGDNLGHNLTRPDTLRESQILRAAAPAKYRPSTRPRPTPPPPPRPRPVPRTARCAGCARP